MIDIQEQVGRICQQAKGGKTVYVVCPTRSRNALTLALLSNLRGSDCANGKTYNIGKGTVCMARPTDTLPADNYTVSLVAFAEAEGDEFRAMINWRDKAASVLK